MGTFGSCGRGGHRAATNLATGGLNGLGEVYLRFETVFTLNFLLLLGHDLRDLSFHLVHHLLFHLFMHSCLCLLKLVAELHCVCSHLVLHLAAV